MRPQPPGAAHEHEHGHAHPHDHHVHPHDHHVHPHGHEHPHERAVAHPADHAHGPGPEPLAAGAGRGKLLFLDCPSGVAGDMTLAALLDLGVPLAAVERALAALPLGGYRLVLGHAHRSGIVATTFQVELTEPHPERSYATIDRLLADAPLEPGVRSLARRIFRRLGEAEATVHATPLDDVHFHEVGGVDAIVDIVGAAAALDYLGADVACSPLPLGRGFVTARHGVLPLPAPATVLCLRHVPTYGVELEVELVTPTGAAIVATAARHFVPWPRFRPERVGHGAGTRELPDRPNVLRAVLGEPSAHARDLGTHVVCEANVDDMTGELAAHAIGALFDAGALDAWAVPIVMKKGRPGLTIAALATHERADAVAGCLLTETTTIGLRRSTVTRTELARRMIEVPTRFGSLPLKVTEGPDGAGHAPSAKPEFAACAAAAREHGVPVRVVLAAALAAYEASTAR
ncbi:MAG: nickel pincer cofactor biosynthesis protein LarC [Polyangiaceae bacterium]|nr:nickel pincer cofactor biosynthesis protein LarC [Polyangiaceae bacterium]